MKYRAYVVFQCIIIIIAGTIPESNNIEIIVSFSFFT
jgi:hypothetical protein